MIAVLVIVTFVILEGITRRVLYRSSKDIKRFSTYAHRVDKLVRGDKPTIAFVGNSITERGIDPESIGATLGARADAFSADDSHLNTWQWMVRSLFWKSGKRPDLVVISFHAHSLEDGRSLEIGRLAQFFTDASDWSELFETTVTTLGSRAELVASSVWGTYAVRDRIKERLLGVVPGYKKLVAFESVKTRTRSTPTKPTWSTLKRFLEVARGNGARVVFVAFPTRAAAPGDPYYLDPDAVQLIESAGMTLLDLRRMPELDPATSYDDEIHLNAAGRAIFSARLAPLLAPLIAKK